MNKKLLLILLIFPIITGAQPINEYFEKIRNNTVELTAFFSQMPKGGDLHHHYSGSIYAETFLNYVIDKDFYINKNTLRVSDKISGDSSDWERFSGLHSRSLLDEYKQKLLMKWSVKDYNQVSYPSDKQFFESFPQFSIASDSNYEKGMMELKRRAKIEHVSYIETMFQTIPCGTIPDSLKAFNTKLANLQSAQLGNKVSKTFDSLYALLYGKDLIDCASKHNAWLEKLHTELNIDDDDFTMRYQNFVLRFMDPVTLFRNLLVAFESANRSKIIVGVNIVAPEDGEVSMKDYWLHMLMFKYCHAKYPSVKYAMHAGELVLGMVKPEELSWHINSAVYEAGAQRIGHGVDLAHEKDCYKLLDYMNEHNIPVEINLFSNEFILKVKDDNHPILLYRKFGVPIVICTDDAGVLRSNLTDQYVLLAKRYKEIKYTEIKRYVYNSVKYSFIEEADVRDKLIADLDKNFKIFETAVLATLKPKAK